MDDLTTLCEIIILRNDGPNGPIWGNVVHMARAKPVMDTVSDS